MLNCLPIQKKIFQRNGEDLEVEAEVEEEINRSIKEDLNHVHGIKRAEGKIGESILVVTETVKDEGGKEDIVIEVLKVILTNPQGEKVILMKVNLRMIEGVKNMKLWRLMINQTPSLRKLCSQL